MYAYAVTSTVVLYGVCSIGKAVSQLSCEKEGHDTFSLNTQLHVRTSCCDHVCIVARNNGRHVACIVTARIGASNSIIQKLCGTP